MAAAPAPCASQSYTISRVRFDTLPSDEVRALFDACVTDPFDVNDPEVWGKYRCEVLKDGDTVVGGLLYLARKTEHYARKHFPNALYVKALACSEVSDEVISALAARVVSRTASVGAEHVVLYCDRDRNGGNEVCAALKRHGFMTHYKEKHARPLLGASVGEAVAATTTTSGSDGVAPAPAPKREAKRKRGGGGASATTSASAGPQRKRAKRVNNPVRFTAQRPLRMTLKNPYLGYIASGRKTWEGRINSGQFAKLVVGDHITFFNHTNRAGVRCKIVDKQTYRSFEEMLSDGDRVSAYLPGVRDLNQGVNVYLSIPSFAQRAARNGVVGLKLELV